MKKTIRNFSYLIICSLLLWLAFYFKSPINDTNVDKRIEHTISRISFGMTPQQIETVKKRGLENYLQAQLNPPSIPQSKTLVEQLASLSTIARKPSDLFAVYQQYNSQSKGQKERSLSVPEKQTIQQKRSEYKNFVARQARQAHIARAIASEHQLQEVMTDFWLNHFNVYGSKKIVPFWLADYENDIRELALGNFHDLLSLTAHHPAMLVYLDNSLNRKPNSRPKGNANGLNENYARELMELHTLGVDGGYTQQDVTALAKILTGWGVDRTGQSGDENSFRFYKQRHDFSEKVFLGETISGSGIAEGEKALAMLATHPATAHFISYKLAQYFVADSPPETLVTTLSKTFLDSQGNLKTVLDTLFHSPEFNDPQYYEVKFQTPFQYLVSVVRVSQIDRPDLKKLEGVLTRLSMPVFGCEVPKGYQNTESAWLNPNGMLNRLGFTISIANGLLSEAQPIDAAALQHTLDNSLSGETQQAIADTPPSLKAAVILGSPEMMYR